jgi:hypothetical protein
VCRQDFRVCDLPVLVNWCHFLQGFSLRQESFVLSQIRVRFPLISSSVQENVKKEREQRTSEKSRIRSFYQSEKD